MAKQIIEKLIDDIDGSEAQKTVTLAIEGTAYELELSEAHLSELYDVLDKFISHGRKIKAGTKPARRPSTQKVRSWAKANGVEVTDRGRIPQDVMERYEAATS